MVPPISAWPPPAARILRARALQSCVSCLWYMAMVLEPPNMYSRLCGTVALIRRWNSVGGEYVRFSYNFGQISSLSIRYYLRFEPDMLWYRP